MKKDTAGNDQLAQLVNRQKELLRRARKGQYPDISKLVSEIDRLIEHKSLGLPQPEHKKFVKWRTFTIGGLDGFDLFDRLMASNTIVDEDALDLLKSPVCSAGNDVKERIDTIILNLCDFGLSYPVQTVTPERFLSQEFVANWSEENRERLDGNVIELLPPHAAPYIRYQYRDQELEYGPLTIAMEPIVSPHIWHHEKGLIVEELVFELFRGDGGQRILSASKLYDHDDEGHSDDRRPDDWGWYSWGLGTNFLFLLRSRDS